MSATTKPTPGSAAAILEVAVHSVAEGRYRHARLTLLRAAASALLPDIVELVNDASTAADLPAGLTPATVIERGKPPMLPGWLDAALDVEIARICAGSPVAEPTPTNWWPASPVRCASTSAPTSMRPQLGLMSTPLANTVPRTSRRPSTIVTGCSTSTPPRSSTSRPMPLRVRATPAPPRTAPERRQRVSTPVRSRSAYQKALDLSRRS